MGTSNAAFAILLPLASTGGGGFSQFVRDLLAPPPLHPILVHFTAALVPLSFCFDLIAKWTQKRSLRAAAAWTLFAAAGATPFVALSGWLWLWQMGEMDHQQMVVHQWLGTTLAAVIIPLAVWRVRYFRADAAPTPLYLVTHFLFVMAVTLQGHIGGMMTFGAASDEATSHVGPLDHNAATRPDDGWKDHLELKD